MAHKELIDRLDPVVDEFDMLLADVRLGVRSAVHYDALEERASGIATQLRNAFRKPSK